MSRSKEGTGLGLALVKALSAMHGGEAVLESALGEGTTVVVRLSVRGRRRERRANRAARRQDHSLQGSGVKVPAA